MHEQERKSNRSPIRVLLADDHTLFRQGLAGLLGSYGGLEIVSEVPNDQEALLKMSEISPAPKVVIVTMFEEPHYVRDLMSLGASAYLLKSVSIEHLIGAVRAAVFDPEGHH